jgi:hypothetical protein
MRFQRPADNLSAECVQDDGEIAELLRQMHVGDISHPELIEAGEHYTAGKIGNDAPVVTRVRCCRHKRGLAQAQKVVLAHQAQHLVIGLPAFTPQESPDPSVGFRAGDAARTSRPCGICARMHRGEARQHECIRGRVKSPALIGIFRGHASRRKVACMPLPRCTLGTSGRVGSSEVVSRSWRQ